MKPNLEKPRTADTRGASIDPVNLDTVRDFLRLISEQAERALKHVGTPGVLQLSRIYPDGDKPLVTRYAIGDFQYMADDAVAFSEAGYNVYIEGRTVHPNLRGNVRGGLEDTVAVFALVIDSDADKDKAWAGNAEASMTVETSPGNAHYWFILKRAIDAAAAKSLGERIRTAAGADHDTGNVTQPYRVAGTINYPSLEKQKRGRTVTPTRLLELNARLWTPSDLIEAFPLSEQKTLGNGGGEHHFFEEATIPADLMKLIRDGAEKGNRSEGFFRAVAWLKQLGWTTSAITTLLEQFPCGIAEKYAGRISVEVARAYGKFEEQAPVDEGVSLNDFHAYMPMHNYIYAPSRETWPASSVNARVPPVPVFDANGKPVLDKMGEQKRIKASTWLDQNRSVEQMTWAPGLDMLICDRLISEGGWIDRNKVTCFNLYRPPTIEHANAAEVDLWLDHVHKVFGHDSAHVVKWLAHRVQRPQEKINHALVLGGAQGIGKDTLLEPVKRAVGPWNFHEVSPQQILGRFNGFAKSVILRVNEARDLGDVNRFQFYDHMKAYTAAPPDVLRVDEKYLREHSVLNCCGVIITTNHKTDSIYLPSDDRRHFVAWSNLTKEDFVDDYWRTLWGWYERGGDRVVAAYLAELDISSFDPKAPPPRTPAFWDIVDANRAPEDAELADVLDRMGNPDATTIIRITAEATGAFEDWIRDRKNRRVIPHRLEKCGYVPVRNNAANDGLWKINGTRQAVYAKTALSIRDRLKATNELTQPDT
jgi:hypothetical protein